MKTLIDPLITAMIAVKHNKEKTKELASVSTALIAVCKDLVKSESK